MKNCARLLIVVVLSLIATGCQSVHWSKSDSTGLWAKKPKKAKKDVPGMPERMVVIWKDAVYEEHGIPMKRGFTGRVYFYDRESQPIKIDGELVVYGFDDSMDERKTQADHKYVISAEEMANCFAESPLGPSYSIWLPWDNSRDEFKQISLIPVFKSTEGKIVRGDKTVNALQGKNKTMDAVAKENSDARKRNTLSRSVTEIRSSTAEQVSFQQPTDEQQRIRSSTIAVSPQTAARLNPTAQTQQSLMERAAKTSSGSAVADALLAAGIERTIRENAQASLGANPTNTPLMPTAQSPSSSESPKGLRNADSTGTIWR